MAELLLNTVHTQQLGVEMGIQQLEAGRGSLVEPVQRIPVSGQDTPVGLDLDIPVGLGLGIPVGLDLGTPVGLGLGIPVDILVEVHLDRSVGPGEDILRLDPGRGIRQ